MKVLNEAPCKYTTELRILHIEVKSNSSGHTNVESKQNLVWSSDFLFKYRRNIQPWMENQQDYLLLVITVHPMMKANTKVVSILIWTFVDLTPRQHCKKWSKQKRSNILTRKVKFVYLACICLYYSAELLVVCTWSTPSLLLRFTLTMVHPIWSSLRIPVLLESYHKWSKLGQTRRNRFEKHQYHVFGKKD